MNVWAVLGFIALGAAISEMYNWRMWQKYMTGMHDGYWIGDKKEAAKSTVIKQLETRRAKK